MNCSKERKTWAETGVKSKNETKQRINCAFAADGDNLTSLSYWKTWQACLLNPYLNVGTCVKVCFPKDTLFPMYMKCTTFDQTLEKRSALYGE